MKGNLLSFHVVPRPAKEGQPIKISFGYRVDKTTITVMIANKNEKIVRYITIQVSGGTGEATFMIPKGWGPSLYINHKDFIAGSVGVDK